MASKIENASNSALLPMLYIRRIGSSAHVRCDQIQQIKSKKRTKTASKQFTL